MLITPDDIRKHRPIASNLDDETRLLMYISEAERLDIMPAIGVELYKDVSENPTDHTELLEGGYYDDGKRYFEGLKAAVSLMSYYRFSLNNPVNATPFGMQRKNALDSEPVEDKTLFRHVNEAKNVGKAYLQQCIDYINFQNNSCKPAKNVNKSKFRIIGQ